MNLQNALMGLFIIGLGAVFAYGGWMFMAPYQAAVDDPVQVDSVVVSSNVSSWYDHQQSRQIYAPLITYSYTINGSEYRADNIFPGQEQTTTSQTRAEEIVADHPEGDTVTAHVNPDNPDQAFLIEQSMPSWYWLGPGIGGLMILLGLKLFFQSLFGTGPSSHPDEDEL